MIDNNDEELLLNNDNELELAKFEDEIKFPEEKLSFEKKS